MPTLVIAKNPFDLHERTIERIPKNRRIKAMCPASEYPIICILNGRPLLRAGWNRRVKQGDVVQFVAMPRGGGGGVMRIVLMIVIMVVAWYIAPTVAGLFSVTSASGIAAVQMAIGFGLSMMVNAMLPPPKLPTPQSVAEMAMQAASPTYNIGAQGNMSRLEQPIPVQYGRHISWPDFAATPYTEYLDNEQWLYQLFVIGQGHFDVEKTRIEDTDINVFDGTTIEIIPPGGSVSLFPAAVIQSAEVSGGDLGVLGPYTASGPTQFANAIGIDLVCPGGLYYYNQTGGMDALSLTVAITARLLDDQGDPVGDWITLGTETISGATNTAIRRSYRYAVTPGRYQIKAQRTDVKNTSNRAAHSVVWGALRAYLPEQNDFGNLTLLAVRLKASSQLSQQASRKINVIATRKLPVWSPTTGWSAPVVTRSIAWALADICRASYGANLADDRYDLPGLYQLDQLWTARGDTFDARFDGKQTVWEALTNVARAGRAKPYQQSGMVRFWRDSPQTLPKAIFQPRNIKAGTFAMEFAPAVTDTTDALRVSYFDERYWQQRDALCYTAGSPAAKPADVQAFGITQRRQAVAEGMYMAAANRYRRRVVTFMTEAEGLLPRFGDLIGINHDMPSWGQSGDVIGWDAATLTATLSEPVEWTSGQNHYIRLVKADGSPTGQIQVSQHAAYDNAVILAVDPGFVPETAGYKRERTRYVFGVGGKLYTEALVQRISPKQGLTVEIQAVVEDPRVHSADQSSVPDSGVSVLPVVPSAPVVTGLVVTEGGTPSAPLQMVSWNSASGADQYWAEYTTDGNNWSRFDTTTATKSILAGVPAGQYLNIRVAGVGLLRGPWAAWLGTSGATVAAPAGLVDLALESPFTGSEAAMKWSPAARASGYRCEVWQGGVQRRQVTITGTRFVYTVEDAEKDGGPWRAFEIRVTPVGVGVGETSSLSVSNPAIGQLNNIQLVSMAQGALWSCQPPSAEDVAGYVVYASKTNGFTPGPANLIYEGKSALRQLPLEPNKVWYIRCGAYDVWGKDGLQLSGQITVNTGAVQAEHISVASLSAIVANLGEIIAGRMHSADNAVDFDLDAKRLTVRDAMGQERLRLGLLGSGNYGLSMRSADNQVNFDLDGKTMSMPGFSVSPAGLSIQQLDVIGTQQVQGNAITVAATASGGTQAQVTITVPPEAAGQPVIVSVSAQNNADGSGGFSYWSTRRWVRAYRNGAQINLVRDIQQNSDYTAHDLATAFTVLDYPGAGTHTYLATIRNWNDSGPAGTGCTIVCSLGKR